MSSGLFRVRHNICVTADTDSMYRVPAESTPPIREGCAFLAPDEEAILDVWAACPQVAGLRTLLQPRFQRDATSAPVLRNASWKLWSAGLREAVRRGRAPSPRYSGFFISVSDLFICSRVIRHTRKQNHQLGAFDTSLSFTVSQAKWTSVPCCTEEDQWLQK